MDASKRIHAAGALLAALLKLGVSMSLRIHSRLAPVLGLLTLGVALLAGAGAASAALIDQPQTGSAAAGESLLVSGRVTGLGPDGASGSLEIDGQAEPFDFEAAVDGGTLSYQTLVPAVPGSIFRPILARYTAPDGSVQSERVVVLASEVLLADEAAPDSVYLHLEQTALDEVVPSLVSMIDLDLATMLPAGTRIASECVADSFFGCVGRAKVDVQVPPSFGDIALELDAQSDALSLGLRVTNLSVELEVNGSGIVPDCDVRIEIDEAIVAASYAVGTDGGIDIHEVDAPGVVLNGFDQDFISGVCDAPIIGDVIQLVVGRVDGVLRNELSDLLRDPDASGPGDASFVDLIEEELGGVSLSSSVGDALGIDLRTPLRDFVETPAGLTLVSDALARGAAEIAGCDAVLDLPAAYAPSTAAPVFDATTPSGAPYAAAVALTTAGINQLLKALTECGLLHVEIAEFEFFGVPVPLTADILMNFIGGLAVFPSETPLEVRVRPSTAPILTQSAGPEGELFEIELSDLRLIVAEPEGNELVEFAVDGRIGLELFARDGALFAEIGPTFADDFTALVIRDQIGADAEMFATVVRRFIGRQLPLLVGEIGPLELPEFLGIRLAAVEVARSDNALALYLDAMPVPEPGALGQGLFALLLLGGIRRRGA